VGQRRKPIHWFYATNHRVQCYSLLVMTPKSKNLAHASSTQSIIEIFRDGEWVPAVALQQLGPERCRLDYLTSYAFSQNPLPISLTMPLTWNPDAQFDRRPPSFIYDLVPQGQGRRFLAKELGLDDSDHMVLPLVAAGAFNPIGALRLNTAVAFYQEQVRRNPPKKDFEGVMLQDISQRSDEFLEHIALHAMLASGTTGVQGVAPKYLLAQDEGERWFADLSLPDAQARAHWLVKLPRGPSAADQAVLRNEAAYLRVAAACGLRTHQPPMLVGNMLFLRRFDREVIHDSAATGSSKICRLHQESLASLAGLRGFAPATSQNELLGALRWHVTDPQRETIEFIKRDILNLALRNTDNHARNSAIQRTVAGRIQLTPVFDFAPMFMDPEMVPRSLHWRTQDKVRLDQWPQIIAELAIPEAERQGLAVELRDFADTVGRLPDIALDCGVDPEVIEQCRFSMAEQAQQLSR